MAKKPQYLPKEQVKAMVADALKPGGAWDRQGRIIRLDGKIATLELEEGHAPMTRTEEREFQMRTGEAVTYLAGKQFDMWRDCCFDLRDWLVGKLEYKHGTWLAVLILIERRAIELSGDAQLGNMARHYLAGKQDKIEQLGRAVDHHLRNKPDATDPEA